MVMARSLLVVALCAIAYGAHPVDNAALAPTQEVSRLQSQAAQVVSTDHTHFAGATSKEAPVAKPSLTPEDGDGGVPLPHTIKFADAPGPSAISTAGKCYLALATLFFVINAVIYVSGELEKREISTVIEGYTMYNTVMDVIMDRSRLDNAKGAMIFIPILAVLMLFVMFRARLQNLDGTGLVPPLIQNFMVLATAGIYLQAVDVIDIRITSEAFGNLSKKFGMLFVYVGYAGVVYGLFTAKDESKPLSVAAQCILALCTLAFALQAIVVFLQNQQALMDSVPKVPSMPVKMPDMPKVPSMPVSIPGMPGAPAGAPGGAIPGADLVKDMFNPVKLDASNTICDIVPLVGMVYMYVHIATVFKDPNSRPPEWARYGMYGGMAGVYVQTLAVLLLRDLNKKLGTVARSIGLLITYGGFIVTLVYALGPDITPGEMGNVGVLGMLYMTTGVLVFKATTVALEEVQDMEGIADKFAQFQKYKETMNVAGTVLQYATILGILMIYIHFRAKIILVLPALPDWITYMELLAMICLFFQVLMVFVGGAMGDNTGTDVMKALLMLGLYAGFGGIVVGALTLDRA